MYHSISDEPESGHPYYWINTSPARFGEHMKFLQENNYTVISLSQAVEIIQSQGSNRPQTGSNFSSVARFHGSQDRSSHPSIIRTLQYCRTAEVEHPAPCTLCPDKLAVLTFDDGYDDFYTHAFPILKKYNYTATAFLPTSFIGNSKPGLIGKKHMDWDKVRELQRNGINFGSHTVTHKQMWKSEDTIVFNELRGSKGTIEEKTGERVDAFCYPYWFPEHDKTFVGRMKDLLDKTGYTCGTGTRIGTTHRADERMILKRVPVNSADDLRFLSKKLSGNYDWVSKIQRPYKVIKAWKMGQVSNSPRGKKYL